MAKQVSVVISGDPVGKQRPRWSRTRMYTPAKTVNYEKHIRELFKCRYPDFKPVTSPVFITVRMYLSIPKSTSVLRRGYMTNELIVPTKKPDVDNCLKIAMDALEGVAYKNDSCVVNATVAKLYSNKPRMRIVMEYDDEK